TDNDARPEDVQHHQYGAGSETRYRRNRPVWRTPRPLTPTRFSLHRDLLWQPTAVHRRSLQVTTCGFVWGCAYPSSLPHREAIGHFLYTGSGQATRRRSPRVNSERRQSSRRWTNQSDACHAALTSVYAGRWMRLRGIAALRHAGTLTAAMRRPVRQESIREDNRAMRFAKYQAIGNDYLVCDAADWPIGFSVVRIRPTSHRP